jgi:hypothetical protein
MCEKSSKSQAVWTSIMGKALYRAIYIVMSLCCYDRNDVVDSVYVASSLGQCAEWLRISACRLMVQLQACSDALAHHFSETRPTSCGSTTYIGPLLDTSLVCLCLLDFPTQRGRSTRFTTCTICVDMRALVLSEACTPIELASLGRLADAMPSTMAEPS